MAALVGLLQTFSKGYYLVVAYMGGESKGTR